MRLEIAASFVELVDCVQDTFPAPEGEVMARTLGIGRTEYLRYTELVCAKAIRERRSFVARDESGRCAGFCINEDFAAAPDYRREPIDLAMQPLLALLEELDARDARARVPGVTFHLYMLGVRRT